jgi:AcrR family transcriptional regulator
VSPRPYQLGRRAEAAASTRRRIVEAAAALHAEQGLIETTYKDVADRAEVGVGTVYFHFPESSDLFAACGHVVRERTAMPTPDVFDNVDGGARVGVLVGELFAAYSRHPSYPHARYAAASVPIVAAMLAKRDEAIRALIAAALPGANRSTINLVEALTCYEVWQSLTRRVSTKTAAKQVAAAVSAAVSVDAEDASRGSG